MTHRDGFPRLSARSAWRSDAGHREPCAPSESYGPSESLGKPSLWVIINVPWYKSAGNGQGRLQPAGALISCARPRGVDRVARRTRDRDGAGLENSA